MDRLEYRTSCKKKNDSKRFSIRPPSIEAACHATLIGKLSPRPFKEGNAPQAVQHHVQHNGLTSNFWPKHGVSDQCALSDVLRALSTAASQELGCPIAGLCPQTCWTDSLVWLCVSQVSRERLCQPRGPSSSVMADSLAHV